MNLRFRRDKKSWKGPHSNVITDENSIILIEILQTDKVMFETLIKLFDSKRCSDSIEGIYVYEKDGEILYIGRGNLVERLKRHFLESFSNNANLSKRHREFFSKYPGKLKIYYMESRGDINKILEWILTIKLKPIFGDKQI